MSDFVPWLRQLAEDGGKGVVNNIDARCLGRIADELERLRSIAIERMDLFRQAATKVEELEAQRSEVLTIEAVEASMPTYVTELAREIASDALDDMEGEHPDHKNYALARWFDASIKAARSSAAAQTALSPSGCDWPDKPFTFHDEPGEHDPCYVVMPDGAMLPLNHHAAPGVDIARAKFIVAACNEALSPDFPRAAVAEAMQDAWNTICTDTGCHPLDIERRGKELFFKPGHWADLVALFLSRSPSVPSAQEKTP